MPQPCCWQRVQLYSNDLILNRVYDFYRPLGELLNDEP